MSELGSYIDELEAEDLDATPDAVLAQDIVELFRFADQIQAQALRRTVRFDRRMAWQGDGSLSMQAWLRKHCRLSPGAARERVTVARRLNDELPETATALEAGEISYSHARGIATATTDLRRGRVREIEPILVDVAREHDPSELNRAVAVWRESADAEAALEQEYRDHTARRFHLSQTFERRWRADGEFDAEGGATITTALNAYMYPDPKGSQPRSPAQRRADALVEMCRQVLDRGDAPTKGGVRPQLNVTVDLETLERRAGTKAAALDWHGPITGETVRRLACDAGVSRVITRGKSEISSSLAIASVSNPDAIVRGGGATSTTRSTGSTAAKPRSTTPNSAAAGTTATFMKAGPASKPEPSRPKRRSEYQPAISRALATFELCSPNHLARSGAATSRPRIGSAMACGGSPKTSVR